MMNGTPQDMPPGLPGMPGPTEMPSMPINMGEEDNQIVQEEPDTLSSIDDSILLQIMQSAYSSSKTTRETRSRQNRKNWDALHGKFDFLSKKQPGQSSIVIPSLETSMEQICAQLSQQLVGFSSWFKAEFEGEIPPLPGLQAEEAVKILSKELERLAVDSGCMPTTYGIGRLIYDSVKIGLIESEITWKVGMYPETKPRYEMLPDGRMAISEQSEMRLRIDIIPFDDFFPDMSPAKHYMIHEMEVAIADLPDLGFTDEEIRLMRGSSPGSEKMEQERRRGGIISSSPQRLNTVMLREYWGDLIHPQTGELLGKAVKYITANDSAVVRKPVRITDEIWCGYRPFINIPILPTPTSPVHHAFLDIAVPLVEAECELFNMVCDGGFNAAMGVKTVRGYMLEDPTVAGKGITAGQTLSIAEGQPEVPVLERVETGTLTQEMLQVFDRISRTRQEATRTNDFQLGRQAQRKTSATEFNLISEASDDLFSNMALRIEDTGVEPLIELCWLLIWQFADEPMIQRIGRLVGPDSAMSIAALSPQERFVAFANSVGFKIQGFKYRLDQTKDIQKLMGVMQMVMQNPALMQVMQTIMSPVKTVKSLIEWSGLDPADLKPDPNEPMLDPAMMMGQAGAPNMAPQANPMQASQQEGAAPPNPQGDRGMQLP